MAAPTLPGTGLLKGLGITLKTMFTRPSTQMYPHERPELEPRTRGVIALMDENCTVCMLCARECPDWCIYIDSHKETVPPAKEGGRARTRNVLDRFAIDFALCMYCGICVEVCPFDALWWSPEFEYAEYAIGGLLHEMDKLREWADTVVPPPPLDEGAEPPSEVVDALEKHRQELAKAEQAALEAEQAEEAAEEDGYEPQLREVPDKPTIADIDIEGETQMDQQVFDDLVEQGKSERMARAKAKAAWVKAEKRKLLDEKIAEWEQQKAEIEQHNAAEREKAEQAAASSGGGAAQLQEVPEKPTIADIDIDEEPQIDQEVFDELVADGKSERMARAKAKASWVKSRKRELLDEKIAEWEQEKARIEEANEQARQQAASSGGGGTQAAAAEAPPKPTLADMEVEGDPQIDQETFDELVEQGKSERMARAKAKAAWVKAEKQKLLDDAIAAWEAEYGGGAQASAGEDAAEPTAEDAQPTLGSVSFEGEVEIDQEVYDELIEQGKSERIARAKAKAAYVKAQKQKMLDEQSDGSDDA